MVTPDFEREEFRRFTRFFAWLSALLAVLAGAAAVLLHATGQPRDEVLDVPLLVGAGVLLVIAALFAWPSISQPPAARPDAWPDEAAPDADADPQ